MASKRNNDVREVRPSRRAWRLKHALEWMAALLATIFLSPVLLIVALLVKLTSRGSVLYVSERLGKNGRVFRLYKFRSMNMDAETILADDGKVVTVENDPRLTPIGRWLRMGFDELPQLLNVLKGDLTLIGPRPDVPWEMDRYTRRERARLWVMPGITGLTQVMGGRELSNAQNYELDVRYVEHATFKMDLLIALVTLPYALGAKGIGRKVFRRHGEGLDELRSRDAPPEDTGMGD